MNEVKTKAGFCAIIGKPNVGKSTLMNVIIGEKLSITTPKPQTTRKRVLGIYTDETTQIVFLDTPGVLDPAYLLQERMLEYVRNSAKDADVLLFIVDASNPNAFSDFFDNEQIAELLSLRQPKLLALNKIDLTDENNVKRLAALFEEKNVFEKVVPISAIGAFNVSTLLQSIIEFLPEHPKYFPDDQLSDATERFFVSEIIREKIFEIYKDEVPYSTEVEIEEFKEREGRKDYIRASIIVERETQKPIIIGAKGAMIKKLGQRAREEIEAFLERPVFLELRVKVRPKWRSNPNMLRRFGYTPDE
jgi:GTP-binding protein Era